MTTATKVTVFDHEVAGSIKCQSPDCPNWFIKAGNRHRYCKAPNCTYRKGMPAPQEQRPLSAGTQELLLRLQDEELAEVGPEMLVQRRKAVAIALRQRDREALSGALLDEATCCVWFADRVGAGEMPQVTLANSTPQNSRPAGLVSVVLASHRRTFELAEHRMKLLWAMMAAREALASAERGVDQTAGSEKEADAQVVFGQKRAEFDQAQTAYEAGEAAWRERALSMRDLSAAA